MGRRRQRSLSCGGPQTCTLLCCHMLRFMLELEQHSANLAWPAGQVWFRFPTGQQDALRKRYSSSIQRTKPGEPGSASGEIDSAWTQVEAMSF